MTSFEMLRSQYFFLDAVFFLKFIHTTTCIQELLFTSEERMAVGANFNAQILFNGTCFKSVATSTSYRSQMIFRLNGFIHDFHLFFALSLMRAQSYIDTSKIITCTISRCNHLNEYIYLVIRFLTRASSSGGTCV